MGKKEKPVLGLPHAELLSIAVEPGQRGQGCAQSLYRELVDHFRERGVFAFRIVVGEQLKTAHQFYKKMGAEPVGCIEVHQGQGSIMYVYRSVTCPSVRINNVSREAL